MRDSFIFYRSFWEAIRDLPSDIQGEVLTFIIEYGLDGATTDNQKPVAKALSTLIKPQLDANITRYENGNKGGAPKGNKNNPNGRRGKFEKNQPRTNRELTENQPNKNVNENQNHNGVGFEACEDFSNLPESLQASLATYFAVRAESGSPVFATQQGMMVAKLLSATGSDFHKAEWWVKNAAVKNWKDFYEPSEPEPPLTPAEKAKRKEAQRIEGKKAVAEWEKKLNKFIEKQK